MSYRPIILTIAGFDPSGCAGILADVKTAEAHNVSSMAVCTANTFQNVFEFEEANWVSIEDMFRQLRLLQDEMEFDYAKVGLVENFEVLNVVIDALLEHNENIKIIWDPIFKASAEYEFHSRIDKNTLENICSKLYLITPNLEEIKLLVPGKSAEEAGEYLSRFCNVLVKGGHGSKDNSNDTLFTKDKIFHFKSERFEDHSKRGTGCVLSSAILSNLANGKSLVQACEEGKKYITKYLTSNNSLMGYHYHEEHK